MAPEVAVDPLIRAEAEELADEDHGDDFAIGEARRGPALAQLLRLLAHDVVDHAEDRREERLEVHVVGLRLVAEAL